MGAWVGVVAKTCHAYNNPTAPIFCYLFVAACEDLLPCGQVIHVQLVRVAKHSSHFVCCLQCIHRCLQLHCFYKLAMYAPACDKGVLMVFTRTSVRTIHLPYGNGAVSVARQHTALLWVYSHMGDVPCQLTCFCLPPAWVFVGKQMQCTAALPLKLQTWVGEDGRVVRWKEGWGAPEMFKLAPPHGRLIASCTCCSKRARQAAHICWQRKMPCYLCAKQPWFCADTMHRCMYME